MEGHEDAQYCFQDENTTCRKDLLLSPIHWTLYIFFSLISVVTVFLNILVIISISHFKHLHTPTNLLILSLAVSDLLVGLVVIPSNSVAIIEPCWFFGNYFCALVMYTTFLCTSLSIGNLVMISIDRYVAVCDPLLYHSKISTTRIKCCIAITWCICILYDAFLIKISVNVEVASRCFEECYFVEGFVWSMIIDLVFSMIFPCCIIITLYLKIFLVARLQARKVLSKDSSVKIVQANKSERKVAKTLGIVVFNYLICWIPIYFIQYIHTATGDSFVAFMCFLPLVNSLLNPIIYAFFYPWFKVTAKRILTLKFSHK